MNTARTLVQRALAGHAAIGLLAGALIYILALSGTIIVIHDRWQQWEQPDVPEMSALSPAAAQAALASTWAAEKGKPRTTHFYIRMPGPDLPRAVATTDHGARYIDAGGRPGAREAHGWTDFLIALHEYLHLPSTWGLMLVGALGVALAALTVTGVVAHPRILRDAFRLRARHGGQVARADWHNRLGVWTLPFVLAVTLTGAFLGLGGIGATVLARAYTGGDTIKVYSSIFGQEPASDPAPAPLPNLAAAMRTLAARVPDARPTYVIAHDPGTRGQHIQIIAEHPRRLIYGESYAFGADGRWRGPAGLAEGALGQQLAASTYNLHFGNYGGLAVELAYIAMGLALCGITATGTTLWLGKRRRRGLGSDRLEAAWTAVIWGTPLAMIAAAWLRAAADSDAPLVALFWLALAAGQGLAAARPAWVGAVRLDRATGVALVATALGHILLLRPSAPPVLLLDAALAATGLLVLAVNRDATAQILQTATES